MNKIKIMSDTIYKKNNGIYGFFGKSNFLLEEAIKKFTSSPLFNKNLSINIQFFRATDTRPNKIIEAAYTLPFLNEFRLIIIKETNLFKTSQLNEFIRYLNKSSPHTCLVFTGEKLNEKTLFAKSLKKKGKVTLFKQMSYNQILSWLKQQSLKKGKKLKKTAAEQLSKLSEQGLKTLDSELEKLSIYIGEKKQISEKDVFEVTASNNTYKTFDLLNFLSQKKLKESLNSNRYLYSINEPPQKTLAMISKYFRQQLEIKSMMILRKNKKEIQELLHLHPFVLNKHIQETHNKNIKELENNIEKIFQSDIKLKTSSRLNNHTILEELIINLCTHSK